MAVYTLISAEDAALFALSYGLTGPVTLQPISAGVTNSNYILSVAHTRYVLTIFEVASEYSDLPFFMDVTSEAARAGLPAPRALIAQDGTTIGRIADKPAALTVFLPGATPKRIDPKRCASVGDTLGRFHVACMPHQSQKDSLRSGKKNTWSLERCAASFDRMRAFISDYDASISEIIQRELQLQLSADKDTSPLTRGIIHGDLFPDNVLFEGTQVSGILDFYFACEDTLLLDVAVTMNAWCFEKGDGDFNFSKASRLVRAYRAAYPAAADDIHHLPRFARLASLRFLLSRLQALYDMQRCPPQDGAVVSCHDPKEYARKLHFHGYIDSYRAYIDV